MKITTFVANEGARDLSRVMFTWALMRAPLNDVIFQDGAGFSNVRPNRRYSTTFEWTFRRSGRVYFWEEVRRTLSPGEYVFEFEVDPDHDWGEPDWARENNICEATITVR
ncbi:hypothetical protein ACFL3S_11865 [Gemmatimonadota bacterium]